MSKEKITRVERFKNEIEEAKIYKSIEDRTVEDSRIIKDKRNDLKKLDPDFFVKEVNQTTHTIKDLKNNKILDYDLNSKLKTIHKMVEKDLFKINKPKLIKNKITFSDELKELSSKLDERLKTFDNKHNIHALEFNKQLHYLNKESEKIKKNSSWTEKENTENFDEMKKTLFGKTQKVKLGIESTEELKNKSKSKLLNKTKLTFLQAITISSTIVAIIIFVIANTGA